MTADVTIAGERLTAHPLRAAVLGEVHARPFTPIETPRRVLHFAFETTAERGEADRAALVAFCASRGLAAPQPSRQASSRACSARPRCAGSSIRNSPPTPGSCRPRRRTRGRSIPPPATLAAPMGLVPQPGPVLVAVDLHLVRGRGRQDRARAPVRPREPRGGGEFRRHRALRDRFPERSGGLRAHPDRRSRAWARARRRAHPARARDRDLSHARAARPAGGAAACALRCGAIEMRLAEVTAATRGAQGLEANQRLLEELTALAAELEAGAAASQFRFGASRAYDEIVQLRLQTIGERKSGGLPTWTSFLARRMAPAMRTCATLEERQASLAEKLARAANLLRTRVDVELEQPEPRRAALDERAHAAATDAAGDRRGLVGRGDQLLRGRAVRLSGEGPARCGLDPRSILRLRPARSCRSRCCWCGGSCGAIRKRHIKGEQANSAHARKRGCAKPAKLRTGMPARAC